MLKTSVPFIGFQPAVTYLPTHLKELGFKSFSESAPEDFHTGAILLTFDTNRLDFKTIIVRYSDKNRFYFTERLNQLPNEQAWEAWMESSMKLDTDTLLYKEISDT